MTAQGVVQLLEEGGIAIPLQHTGPCQYRLGTTKFTVRLVNGHLMVRSGAGHLPILAWLEMQVPPRTAST